MSVHFRPGVNQAESPTPHLTDPEQIGRGHPLPNIPDILEEPADDTSCCDFLCNWIEAISTWFKNLFSHSETSLSTELTSYVACFSFIEDAIESHIEKVRSLNLEPGSQIAVIIKANGLVLDMHTGILEQEQMRSFVETAKNTCDEAFITLKNNLLRDYSGPGMPSVEDLFVNGSLSITTVVMGSPQPTGSRQIHKWSDETALPLGTSHRGETVDTLNSREIVNILASIANGRRNQEKLRQLGEFFTPELMRRSS